MVQLRKSSLPFLLIYSLLIHSASSANDTIQSSESIRDGETLVSSGGKFELGFFSPGNSTNRYVGIWDKNIPVQTAVWVANRQVPLTTKSGVLKVTEPGILALLNDINGIIIWSSNTSRSVRNPAAQLLDSGNLVLKDANENMIWQSFDYPSDTCLPGMGWGWDFVTGKETYITSWRSYDDPGLGEYTCHVDPTGYPQIVQKRLNAVQCRTGPWNGVRFSGAPGKASDLTLQMNKSGVKYWDDISSVDQSPMIIMMRLDPDGIGGQWVWNYETNSWDIHHSMPIDRCDSYSLCGAFGVCNIGNSPPCGCLDKFVPRDQQGWSRTDWSNGCVRRVALNCSDDVFFKYSEIKLPDSRYSWFNEQRISLADCEEECLRNCSCVAYAQLDIRDDLSGCLFYNGDLIDIRTVTQGGGDLYIRIASTEFGSKRKNRVILIASLTSAAGMVLVFLIFIVFGIKKRKKDPKFRKKGPFSGSHREEADLPFFNMSSITKATNNFSINNKLGESGFGPVYKV